jgi:hypothetical protein
MFLDMSVFKQGPVVAAVGMINANVATFISNDNELFIEKLDVSWSVR